MCEFCVKHGEGKKWYLNAKNYNSDLLSDIKRTGLLKDFFYWTKRQHDLYFKYMKWIPVNVPLFEVLARNVVKKIYIDRHWGQIVPIEDVEKILSSALSIVRIPCVCRKITMGIEKRSCFIISMDLRKAGMADIVDRSFFGGPDVTKFETFNRQETLNFMRSLEREGYYHSIWTIGTPFAAGICNCNNTGCISMRLYKNKTPIFFKAEYIAQINKLGCIGCKACLKICPFDAIMFDNASKKAYINNEKCYGCGICRAACKNSAISLQDRKTVFP